MEMGMSGVCDTMKYLWRKVISIKRRKSEEWFIGKKLIEVIKGKKGLVECFWRNNDGCK